MLDDVACDRIGPRLEPESASAWAPKKLLGAPFAFAGVDNSKGLAFVLTSDDPWLTVLRSESNSLLRPYISGNDITDHGLQKVRRWALDVGDRDLDEIRRGWPRAFEFLTGVVKPTRTSEELRSYKGLVDRWWQYWNHRADQTARLRRQAECIVFPKAAKYAICMLAPTDWIYTNMVMLVEISRPDLPAICLSSAFRDWLYAFSVRGLGNDPKLLRLSISEAVASFPLPQAAVAQAGVDASREFSATVGHWSATQGDGLTGLMNLVHRSSAEAPAAIRARELMCVIDHEVLHAYGWDDVNSRMGFRSYAGATDSDPWRWSLSAESASVTKSRLTELNRLMSRTDSDARAKSSLSQATPRLQRARGGWTSRRDSAIWEQEEV